MRAQVQQQGLLCNQQDAQQLTFLYTATLGVSGILIIGRPFFTCDD